MPAAAGAAARAAACGAVAAMPARQLAPWVRHASRTARCGGRVRGRGSAATGEGREVGSVGLVARRWQHTGMPAAAPTCNRSDENSSSSTNQVASSLASGRTSAHPAGGGDIEQVGQRREVRKALQQQVIVQVAQLRGCLLGFHGCAAGGLVREEPARGQSVGASSVRRRRQRRRWS